MGNKQHAYCIDQAVDMHFAQARAANDAREQGAIQHNHDLGKARDHHPVHSHTIVSEIQTG